MDWVFHQLFVDFLCVAVVVGGGVGEYLVVCFTTPIPPQVLLTGGSTIGLAMLWAVMFLVGGLVPSSYKWGFFVFAVLIYFFIVWQVLGVARAYARRVEPGVHKMYLALSAWTLSLMYVILNPPQALVLISSVSQDSLPNLLGPFGGRQQDPSRLGISILWCP